MKKSCPKYKSLANGFTLVELMVVMSIVLVLMAVTASVYTVAKRSSKDVTVLSGLRQCSAAVLIYESDNEGYPTMSATREVLAHAPTCDPEDYWNPGCKLTSLDPLVGSFAYAGGVSGMESPQEIAKYLDSSGSKMFLSIFHSDNRIDKFLGNQPANVNQCVLTKTCLFPNKLIEVRNDGSAKSKKFSATAVVGATTFTMPMTWINVFAVGVKYE